LLLVIRDFSLVSILVAVRLLKPLGNPSAYNVKFFAASELLEQVEDRAWLARGDRNHRGHKGGVSRKRPDGDGITKYKCRRAESFTSLTHTNPSGRIKRLA
jgi:hypothetical protein